MPFVDKGAEQHSLVGCSICNRGFPLDEMHMDDMEYVCADCWTEDEDDDA